MNVQGGCEELSLGRDLGSLRVHQVPMQVKSNRRVGEINAAHARNGKQGCRLGGVSAMAVGTSRSVNGQCRG